MKLEEKMTEKTLVKVHESMNVKVYMSHHKGLIEDNYILEAYRNGNPYYLAYLVERDFDKATTIYNKLIDDLCGKKE
jgi:hypothetical protein